MHGDVVEHVPIQRPQELRLRAGMGAQTGELLGGLFELEDLDHFGVGLGGARAIVLRLEIKHQDVLALLGEDADAGFLAQRAFGDQAGHPLRHQIVRMPGVVLQVVGHGADHVCQRVDTDHVHGAVGRALRPADQRAGDRIHRVKAQAQSLGVMHHCQHREDADAIGDKVRRVHRANDALAKAGGEKAFEPVKQRRVSALAGNQLGEVHVARRIEEMHAAEAAAQCLGEGFGKAVD